MAKERNESARLKTPPEALHGLRWRRLPAPDDLLFTISHSLCPSAV
jgi:hypothetical protein